MAEEAQPPRKRGRPKGHRLSVETKRKIRKSLRVRAKAQKAVRATDDRVQIPVRLAIIEREGRKCRGCHGNAPGDDLRVYVFVPPEKGGSLEDPWNLALLCSWCRREAHDFGKTSARQVPGEV